MAAGGICVGAVFIRGADTRSPATFLFSSLAVLLPLVHCPGPKPDSRGSQAEVAILDDMSGWDAHLWRIVQRLWLLLAIGVCGLLLGLGPRPDRVDSLLGVLIIGLVIAAVVTTIARMPIPVRRAMRQLPRRRPMLTVASSLLAAVTVLILCWTIANAVTPGTLTPLTLAFVGVVVAGVPTLFSPRLISRSHTGWGKSS